MTQSKHLGIFWGNEAIYFVEQEDGTPKKNFHVPFNLNDTPSIKKDIIDPRKSKIAANIKSALNQQKISTNNTNLSLPTRDIIFRSFIIPSMQPHEIKSVVEFEISKYIPFSLDELSFAFHPINIDQENLKLIRIIFIAIKKDALESYLNVLESCSLSVNMIEPGSLSMIRALNYKNQIPKNQTLALVEMENVGRITIIDNDVPQFVREFHLSSMPDKAVPEDENNDIKKLAKEVRISLDYFNRQNEQLQVKKIFLLALSQKADQHKHIESFLNIPVSSIGNQGIIKETPKIGLGILNAYGVSIASPKSTPMAFSLLNKKLKQSSPREPSVKRKYNFKSTIVTALICVPLAVGALVFSSFTIQKFDKNINLLHEKLGPFQDLDLADIQQKDAQLRDTLNYLKNTRAKSNTALFLLIIPDLLPDGTWIDNLNIKYDDSKFMASANKSDVKTKKISNKDAVDITPTLTITINGYSYSEDKNQQFRLVNTLLGALKDSKEFSYFFENIDLQTTNFQKLNDEDVTFFKIVCIHNYGLTGFK